MHLVGRINRDIYKCVTPDIVTDEVIITDERIGHIVERRGQDFYDEYHSFFPQIISDPDYIFNDKRKNTALVCKTFKHKGDTVNLVLRFVIEGESPDYKNSIITAIKENAKRFAQRLRNDEPIYRKVDVKE